MAIDALHILLNMGNFIVNKCYEPFVDQEQEGEFLAQIEKKAKRKVSYDKNSRKITIVHIRF